MRTQLLARLVIKILLVELYTLFYRCNFFVPTHILIAAAP